MKRINSCILAVSLMASAAWVQASEMHVLGGLIGGAIGAGVGKSGSPTSIWMMSRPAASSCRARVNSSTT